MANTKKWDTIKAELDTLTGDSLGTQNDQLFQYLVGLGYTGTLNDMVHAYYVANGGYDKVLDFLQNLPSSAPSAYRYWRILQTAKMSSYGVPPGQYALSVFEVELRESHGGADVSAEATITAESADVSFPASNAIDDNLTTAYSGTYPENHNNPQWLMFDFGAGNEKAIVEVTSKARTLGDIAQQWSNGSLQYSSNGTDWTSLFSIADSVTKQSFVNTYRNPADVSATYRFIGIRVTATQGGSNFGIRELEIRATVSGADQTTGKEALSKFPFQGTNPVNNVIDNTTSEYGNHSGQADIIIVDFGDGNEFVPAEIAITARGAGLQSQAPITFDIIAGKTMGNWVTLASKTSPATWAGAETRLFTI